MINAPSVCHHDLLFQVPVSLIFLLKTSHNDLQISLPLTRCVQNPENARLFLRTPEYPNWKINTNERAGSSPVYVTMGIMRIFTISSRQCKCNYRIKLIVNCNFCAKSLASGRMCQKLNLASKEFIIQIGNIFSLLFRVILQKETWLYKFINEKEYVHIISRIHCQGASEKKYNPLAPLTGTNLWRLPGLRASIDQSYLPIWTSDIGHILCTQYM